MGLDVRLIVGDILYVELGLRRFRVAINCVMDGTKALSITVSGLPLPYDLVPASIAAKDLVQYGLRIRPYMPVEMNANRSLGVEQFAEKDNSVVEPLYVRVETFAPRITIGFLLYDRCLFLQHLVGVRNRRGDREIRAC